MTRDALPDLRPDRLPHEHAEAVEHAVQLAGRLLDRGLRDVSTFGAGRAVGLSPGAVAVKALHPEINAERVVVVQPDRANALKWHWRRRLVNYDADVCWLQPFCPADAYDQAAGMFIDTLAIDARTRARDAHVGSRRSREIDRRILDRVGRHPHALVYELLEEMLATQRTVENPTLLRRLHREDHLATRALRVLERLAVLAGSTGRRLPEPLDLATLIRLAGSQVLGYQRVRVPPVDIWVDVPRESASDLTLLLAELAENAIKFSPPDTEVWMVPEQTSAGVSISITDRGSLLTEDRRAALNSLLAAPDSFDVFDQILTGTFGLPVVARCAARLGVRVVLHPRDGGGTTALVELPDHLLLEPQPFLPPPAPNSGPNPAQASAFEAVAPPAPARGPGEAAPASGADEVGDGQLPRRRRASVPQPVPEAVPEAGSGDRLPQRHGPESHDGAAGRTAASPGAEVELVPQQDQDQDAPGRGPRPTLMADFLDGQASADKVTDTPPTEPPAERSAN